MLNRIVSALALSAGILSVAGCAGNTAIVSSGSGGGQHVYVACSTCNGTNGNSGVYAYATNSSSATPTSSFTTTGTYWYGVALDSSGNIYVPATAVASPSASSVVEYAAGATGASPTPVRTITSRYITNDNFDGFTIGTTGILYYFDNIDRFEVYSATAGTNATPTIVNNATSYYTSAAVDSAGDLFFTNGNPGGLYVLPAGFTSSTVPTQILFGTTPWYAEAVSLDSSGNIYIVGKGTAAANNTNSYLAIIPKTLQGATAVTPTKILTLTGASAYYFPVALDSSGNIYSAASYNPIVVNEYAASAATGTTPTPINTITTTLSASTYTGWPIIAIY